MITNIGAILTMEEVEILKQFIEKSFDIKGPITDNKIMEMMGQGIWHVYAELKSITATNS
jgi:hypothetical protein